MSDPFNFLPTPLEQLQQHDSAYWRSPFGVVHTDRCQWCFSICEGWQGFDQLDAALGKHGKCCHECIPPEREFLISSLPKLKTKTNRKQVRSPRH